MSAAPVEKTEKQKMLSHEYYHPGHSELCEDRKSCQEALVKFNDTPTGPEKTEIARNLFAQYGESVFVNKTFKCDYGYNISIGDHTEINYDCTILDIGKVTIGKNVFMGPSIHIYAVNHPVDPTLRRTGIEIGQDVTIEDDVWLGGCVVVLPGVTIGHGSTIGAGSVVTKDIPCNSVAVGNPAKVVKTITPS